MLHTREQVGICLLYAQLDEAALLQHDGALCCVAVRAVPTPHHRALSFDLLVSGLHLPMAFLTALGSRAGMPSQAA